MIEDLKLIQDFTIDEVKESEVFTGYNDKNLRVREYLGEFEDNGEWTNVYPCAFIDFGNVRNKITSASGEVLKKEAIYNIYIGQGNNEELSGLEIISKIYKLFDNLKITHESSTYNFSFMTAEFYGADKGMKSWRVEVRVS